MLQLPGLALRSQRRVRRRFEPRLQVAGHLCAECRKSLYRHRIRTAVVAATAVAVMVVGWFLMGQDSTSTLGAVLLLFGWPVPIFANLICATTWDERTWPMSLDPEGTVLIVSDPHPDYVRAALAAGARFRPDGPKPIRDFRAF